MHPMAQHVYQAYNLVANQGTVDTSKRLANNMAHTGIQEAYRISDFTTL